MTTLRALLAALGTPRFGLQMRGRRRRVVTAIVGLSLVGAMAGASPAIAAEQTSPWWGITTGSRPTDLRIDSGRTSVQEIVTAPGEVLGLKGSAFTIEVEHQPVGTFASEPLSKELAAPPFEITTTPATVENIQKALEAVSSYGSDTSVSER